MIDSHNRDINYLRISITDKCNLRCWYCMPEEGVARRPHEDYLSFEAITAVVREAVALGITKVRLTGGEPLVKRGIVDLVGLIKSVKGVSHLAITTNGVLLADLVADLKRVGLDSVNISLDTLDPNRYREITRTGNINAVHRGIDAARRVGLPVKINTVVLPDTTQDHLEKLRRYCLKKNLTMQLINHFSLTEEKKDGYQFNRPPNCASCNRIRLMADGKLKPCLHSDVEFDIDLVDIRSSLIKAIKNKPARGSICKSRDMIEIGG